MNALTLSFNSFMVRLEVGLIEPNRWLKFSFNSFMVRLEVVNSEWYNVILLTFQFLYGAIGRIKPIWLDFVSI